MSNPTPAQAALIRYYAGLGKSPDRTIHSTYRTCERRGWIAATGAWPHYKTTDAGLRAVGSCNPESTH